MNNLNNQFVQVTGLYYYPQAIYSRTLLHSAAQWDYLGDVDGLLKIMDVNSKDELGITPLHLCSGLDMAKKLCIAGADIHARDMEQETPLHKCHGRNTVQVLHYMVQQGADLEARNMRGDTPLHVACRYGDVEYVRMFLYNGADTTALNDRGETALDVALEEQYIDIINELFPYLDDCTLCGMSFYERSNLLLEMLWTFDISSLLYGIFKSDRCQEMADVDNSILRASFESTEKFIQKYYYNLCDVNRYLDILRVYDESTKPFLDWNWEMGHYTSNVFITMVFNAQLLVNKSGMIDLMFALLSYGAVITENDFLVILMADNLNKREKFEFLCIAISCSTHDLPLFDIPNVLSKFIYSKYLLCFSVCSAEEILNAMLKLCKLPIRCELLRCINLLLQHATITQELEDNYKTYIVPIVPITNTAVMYHNKNMALLKTKRAQSLVQLSAAAVRKQIVTSIAQPQGIRALFSAISKLEIPPHLKHTIMYKDKFVS